MIRFRTDRPAKTLLEVLLVVAIAAVLIGLLLSAVQKVRLRAARLKDENNLRQVGLAAQAYQSDHGRLPPLVGVYKDLNGYDQSLPTAVWLLPQLEQPTLATLFPKFNVADPYPWQSHVVPAYTSASDPSHVGGRVPPLDAGVGNVAFNVQVFGPDFAKAGVIDGRASLATSFPDGTSATLLLATKRGRCGPTNVPGTRLWGGSYFVSSQISRSGDPSDRTATVAAFFGQKLPAADGTGPTFQAAPAEVDCDPDLAQGFQPRWIVVGRADGGTQTVSTGIAPKLWRAGLLPADGAGLPVD